MSDFDSKHELLPTNTSGGITGDGIPEEKRKRVLELYAEGKTNEQVAMLAGVSKPVCIAIKKKAGSGGLDVVEWKRQVSAMFAGIVQKGAERLMVDIDNIPAGQLPLAIAILTDKILALQDAPQTIVEHRLKISHDDINKMLKGEVIDISPKAIDNKDSATQNPNPT
jgi:hypothetical protein